MKEHCLPLSRTRKRHTQGDETGWVLHWNLLRNTRVLSVFLYDLPSHSYTFFNWMIHFHIQYRTSGITEYIQTYSSTPRYSIFFLQKLQILPQKQTSRLSQDITQSRYTRKQCDASRKTLAIASSAICNRAYLGDGSAAKLGPRLALRACYGPPGELVTPDDLHRPHCGLWPFVRPSRLRFHHQTSLEWESS